jgi:cell division protease FtsH
MLGGRAAEDVVFGELTAGASEDIKRCTELARKMVTEYGMSPLGPIFYEARSEFSWLAQEFGEGASLSEEMSAKIDKEINKIVDTSYEQARKILTEKREVMDKVAKKLLEVETIDGEEFKSLIN